MIDVSRFVNGLCLFDFNICSCSTLNLRYKKFTAPGPSALSKFEILLVKIFGLKQKLNQIFQLLKRKSNFVSSGKQPQVPSDYNF